MVELYSYTNHEIDTSFQKQNQEIDIGKSIKKL
jgi:hypothetical protein